MGKLNNNLINLGPCSKGSTWALSVYESIDMRETINLFTSCEQEVLPNERAYVDVWFREILTERKPSL